MKDYKVIDCFPFNGEFEMLRMRLDYYNDSVDYFIISESDATQTGEKKELTYPSNAHLFEEYKDKIVYCTFTPTQEDIDKRNEDRFFVENQHVDSMRTVVMKLSDENTLIMLNGVDEFPKKELFDEMREITKEMRLDAVSCNLKTFYYSPLCELAIDCYATVAINDLTLRLMNHFSDLRKYTFNCRHIQNAGWHLSFFHTPEFIRRKIKTYSHSEFNIDDITNLDNIKYRMYNFLDVLNRPNIKTIKHEQISNEFPMEFYRHEIFFRNTFERVNLKPQMILRKNSSMQIPLEIENLQQYVNYHNPKVVVEIGTARGGTLSRWLEIPSVETIISIDYPVGGFGAPGWEERTYVISDALEQANLCKKEFYSVNGDSKHPYLINRVEELLNGKKIDFLFIDGDHTYEGSKNDFKLYERFLENNSLIAFHDVIDSEYHRFTGCYVCKFWDEIYSEYHGKEFIYTEFLDQKILPMFYDISYDKGGFGGIGCIEYSKKRLAQIEISLLIPVYQNAGLTIEMLQKTLEASTLINQVVLYSNGTSDEENKILTEYSKINPIVEVYITPNALGFVKAVNKGIRFCKNEYILCMNSDANLGIGWEQLLLPLIIDKKNGLIGPVVVDGFILGCCFIMKKSILNKIGLLNEGFGMGYAEDVEISYRIKENGYNLGYVCNNTSSSWVNSVNFPIYHIQGVSFINVNPELVQELKKYNLKKVNDYKVVKEVIVLKDLSYEELKNSIDDNNVFVAVNKSGNEFEKIRFDDELTKKIHLFECTDEMNIDEIIFAVTMNKKIIKTITSEKINNLSNNSLTWLAKFDDHASMGILSQRILENLKQTNISCKSIIGKTETDNPLVYEWLSNPINHNLGIMFSYPDMFHELNEFQSKVIYTGIDTTGGIPNFAQNANKSDFLLTPSNLSKERMIKLGVNKPIFVFPHGIDKEKFTYTPRIITDKFKFLYVGECSDRKGMFQLFEVFVKLFGDNPNVELHIKSNDAMVFYNGQDFKNYTQKYKNIFWRVSNEGHDVILDLYKECHVYVYPSRADTFGMTLIEAMACGLPIISTSEPGASELIKGRYYEIPSKLVPVKNHPWMLGEWGDPDINALSKHMKYLYENYNEIISSGKLEEYSNYIREKCSWDVLVDNFEKNILPKLYKKPKIITLLTSYNRPHHIKNVINSLKDIRENGCDNDVYIVENSNPEIKAETLQIIKENIDDKFILYNSDFNMGQRGALLQMLEDINIDDYDFIQFTDQDNLYYEPLTTYCDILNENQDIFFATGYMSKEHAQLGWMSTRFGNLCEKRSLRAGHMFMRINDLKKLFPLHLDAHYGKDYNSSWNAGLDWEISWWNKNSPGKNTDKNFVLCVPGGVIHNGMDSTMYNWDVNSCEYPLDELIKLRKNPNS